MSSKKSRYASIRKWTGKQDGQSPGFKELIIAVNAYEAAIRELQELKASLKAKIEQRKTAYDAMDATYKLAKLNSKRAPVPDETPGKAGSTKKADKRAAKTK
ncbi:MAG TPA: hypothetical protein DIC34_09400 [Treponema sp.]|nr:MAG: hypothetical protein A2413_16195 [Treponema sp. RIFOXYC1_FULL_61_9]HCM26743.1 hypothetical protein [Treponema sp.]